MSEASASPPQPTVAKRSVTSRRRSSIPFLGSPKSVDQITVMVAEEESKLPDRNSADASAAEQTPCTSRWCGRCAARRG